MQLRPFDTAPTHPLALVLLAVGVVIVVAACVGWMVALWLRRARRRGEGGDGGGNDFRRGPSRPSPPGPTGDGDEPSWWTEFEREFAAYAARRRSESVR